MIFSTQKDSLLTDLSHIGRYDSVPSMSVHVKIQHHAFYAAVIVILIKKNF